MGTYISDFRKAFLWALWLICAALPAAHAETVFNPQAVIKSLPDLDYTIQDGLYATVCFSKSFEKPKIKTRSIKLKDIPGFEKELKVRVMWQTGENDKDVVTAPLAIALLGLNSKDDDDMAKLLQDYLYEAGCHVLVFDSVFSRDFNKRSQHGVSGYLKVEAETVLKIVDAFLNSEDVDRSRMTSLRLLGTSYGGSLALNVEPHCRNGHSPLRVDRVLALSPTVSLRSAARLLDSYYLKDFGSYDFDMWDLADLRDNKPVEAGKPVPFQPRLMRAGIGFVFRNELKKVVKESNKTYDLNVLEQYKEAEKLRDEDLPRHLRLSKEQNWSFEKYVTDMAFPYWSKKGRAQSVDELWDAGDLTKLLPKASGCAHVVLTADDPLNDPAELNALQSNADGKLTVIPRGGHLGYLGTEWARALITTYFK